MLLHGPGRENITIYTAQAQAYSSLIPRLSSSTNKIVLQVMETWAGLGMRLGIFLYNTNLDTLQAPK